MGTEIERKFVLPAAPARFADTPSQRIEQGYLDHGDDVEIRLRRLGERTLLTFKQGNGERREEDEFDIPAAGFAALWPLTDGRRIVKTRSWLHHEGHVVELDVYEDELSGLVVAEIEFESGAASAAFDPPGWLGREVTGDKRFSNRELAVRGKPPIDRSYRLRSDETVGAGIYRSARGRAESAAEHLRVDASVDFARAVHDARTDIKKLRAVLRLVRDGLGSTRYKDAHKRYRDAAGLLAGARDAEVKLATLADLRKRYADEMPDVAALQASLEAERHRHTQADSDHATASVGQAAEMIEAGAAEIDDWQLPDGGFALVRSGLARSYGDGRAGLRSVQTDPSEETVHEWRKRVKDLWYQARLLHEAWPAAMTATAGEAHELSALLGDHHDLSVLISEGRRDVPDEPGLPALEVLARRRQGELVALALPIGKRLYAEKPAAFVRRIDVYWRSRRDVNAYAAWRNSPVGSNPRR